MVGLNYLLGIQTGQVALLAPTEVLAFQHYQNLQNWVDNINLKYQTESGNKFNLPLNKLAKKSVNLDNQPQLFLGEISTIFVTSKNIQINGKQVTKKTLKDSLSTFSKIFWVGTHALLHNQDISPDLVMVDEQHRFGVGQRQTLKNSKLKIENEKLDLQNEQKLSSHFVSFTATPIPRTLSLTLLDTLKPHFLEPIRERKIATSIEKLENLDSYVLPIIQSHLVKQRKVFLIVPKIEEDETDQLWNVSKLYTWAEKNFSGKVMQVHGKIKDKSKVLSEFAESEMHQILVSTTVIEVGVDITEASLIIIFNAERFGLAALHQLRGRVGRNTFPDNECVLLTNNYSVNKPRLQFLTTSQDGYEIAEKDLELRGSGDIIGKQQSGFLEEIEDVVGLDTSIYSEMKNMVDSLDWPNLEQLPRLKKYLDKAVQDVWQE